MRCRRGGGASAVPATDSQQLLPLSHDPKSRTQGGVSSSLTGGSQVQGRYKNQQRLSLSHSQQRLPLSHSQQLLCCQVPRSRLLAPAQPSLRYCH